MSHEPGTKRKRRGRLVSLSAFLVLCLAVSAVGGGVTATSVHGWYQTLNKPAFTPPDGVFAPVWIFLYLLMGVSAWIVWERERGRKRRLAMALFGVQLSLNLAWSFIFFGARAVGWALIELGFLWAAIAGTIYVFWQIDRLAGGLLVPYFLWVSFAGILNAAILSLNG